MFEQEMAQQNLILKVNTGSFLYGTNTPSSDKDYVGVFIPNKDYVLGLKRCEQVENKTNPSSSGHRNSVNDVDCTYYSLPKFIHLALGNNPNIIEIFFTPITNITFIDSWGWQLLDSYRHFICQRVKDTFLGYAFSQRQKIRVKKDRMDSLARGLGDIRAMGMSPESVLKADYPVKGLHGLYKTYAKGTQLGYVLNDLQTLLGEYGGRTSSIETHGYDLKFASHLIRLLAEGQEFLETGELVLPLKDKELLLAIKRGDYSLEEVEKMASTYESLVEEASQKTELPKTPNLEKVNDLQIEMLESYWRKLT